MAGSSIGKAALTLSTDNAGLDKGLSNAYNSVQNFQNRVSSGFKKINVTSAVDQVGNSFRGAVSKLSAGTGSILTGAGGAISGTATRIGTALASLGPYGLAAAAALALVAAGAVATITVLASVANNIDRLASIGKLANTLGVASDQFMGLSVAAKKAGVDGDQFGQLLQKAQVKIASGSPEVQAALSRMGMTLDDLRGKSPDEQFYAIARGMSSVSDSGTRALIATKLFEEGGLKLLPVLDRGEAGLRKFVDQQKKLGTALDDQQMGKILRAKSAMPDFGAFFQGAFNKVTAGLAPIIESIGGFFQKWLDRLAPISDWLSRAADTVGSILGPAISEATDLIFEGVDAVSEWLGELLDFGGTWPSVGEVITTVLKGVGIGGAYVWDTFKAGIGTVSIGISYLVEGLGNLLKSLRSVAESLSEVLDLAGLADQKKFMARFDQQVGAADQDAAKLRNWGQGTLDNFGKSADQVEKWFDKIAKKQGDALTRPLRDAEQIASATLKKFDTGIAERGSKEDYTARIRYELGGAANISKAQLDAARLANDLLKRQNAQLEKIANKAGVIVAGVL